MFLFDLCFSVNKATFSFLNVCLEFILFFLRIEFQLEMLCLLFGQIRHGFLLLINHFLHILRTSNDFAHRLLYKFHFLSIFLRNSILNTSRHWLNSFKFFFKQWEYFEQYVFCKVTFADKFKCLAYFTSAFIHFGYDTQRWFHVFVIAFNSSINEVSN